MSEGKSKHVIRTPELCYEVREMLSGKQDAWFIGTPQAQTTAFLESLPDWEGKQLMVEMVKAGKFQVKISSWEY